MRWFTEVAESGRSTPLTTLTRPTSSPKAALHRSPDRRIGRLARVLIPIDPARYRERLCSSV